ncbi:MAG: RidA family protein [Phycisphaerae bacterium]|nr:RidA family protein [Phycisphaerae bacterium]
MSAEKPKKVEAKLTELGLALPPTPAPVGAYVPAVRTGKLIVTSGQLPLKDGKLLATGKVPADVPLEVAQAAAAQAVLNALAAAKTVAGSLEAIARVVRLKVFVNSSAGFTDQAKVANGASEVLLKLFGDAGRHTRRAIGAAELPLNSPVVLDLILELAPSLGDLG